ncbi:MAG: gluconate 2-dehydrogenase subunit 3 family protein [Deltaproteobacteria bacterium]|nr:gluconate 2-dehydrogenase subunit 3 family protein [Deltaproteobacteria bacterium]
MSEERGRVSRRDFLAGTLVGTLAGTLAGTGGLWIDAAMPRPLAAAEARDDRSARALAPREWKLVEAITARILPSDDTPGALEAGCVHFIDRALTHEDAAALPRYRGALKELDRVCRAHEAMGFAECAANVQDRILGQLETGSVSGWRVAEADPKAFFKTVRLHTIMGFTLDPSYGGNRDYVGWKTMGFPGPVHHLGGSRPEQMRGQPPFVPIWDRNRPGHHDDS